MQPGTAVFRPTTHLSVVQAEGSDEVSSLQPPYGGPSKATCSARGSLLQASAHGKAEVVKAVQDRLSVHGLGDERKKVEKAEAAEKTDAAGAADDEFIIVTD